jgi:hypothetical protein
MYLFFKLTSFNSTSSFKQLLLLMHSQRSQSVCFSQYYLSVYGYLVFGQRLIKQTFCLIPNNEKVFHIPVNLNLADAQNRAAKFRKDPPAKDVTFFHVSDTFSSLNLGNDRLVITDINKERLFYHYVNL